jgi:hypothetical protein
MQEEQLLMQGYECKSQIIFSCIVPVLFNILNTAVPKGLKKMYTKRVRVLRVLLSRAKGLETPRITCDVLLIIYGLNI